MISKEFDGGRLVDEIHKKGRSWMLWNKQWLQKSIWTMPWVFLLKGGVKRQYKIFDNSLYLKPPKVSLNE